MDACRQYQRLIADEVDGTASAPGRERLQRHLADCAPCFEALRELTRTRELLTRLPPVAHSPKLVPALRAALRGQRVGWLERLWSRLTAGLSPQPVAVAAVLLICIALTGATIHPAGPLHHLLARQAEVVQVYAPPVGSVDQPPADAYLVSCVLNHESFDRDRAFGDPEGFQTVSYAP